MSMSRRLVLILGLLACTAPVVSAAPLTVSTPVLIDFDGMARNARNGSVGAYVQSVLTAGGYNGTVTITGARGANGYDGEGYAVGPVINGRPVSMTLGSSDRGLLHSRGNDNFIVNDAHTNSPDRFTMTFSEPIYGVAFDFEIFPNGNVPDGTNPNHRPYPDFTFDAYDGDQLVEHYFVVSILPRDGAYRHSPNSGPNRDELAPQYLGSAVFSFPNGVDRLVFIDWPEMIGVDNLQLQIAPQAVIPEPSSLVLLIGTLGAWGAGSALWRRSWRVVRA